MLLITRIRLKPQFNVKSDAQYREIEKKHHELKEIIDEQPGLWCPLVGVERGERNNVFVVHGHEPRGLRDVQKALSSLPSGERDITVGYIAGEVLRGLARLERLGIQHRALSLDALRVTDKRHIQIQSLGAWYMTGYGSILASDASIGDPLYLPPEVLRHGPGGPKDKKLAGHVSSKADVWALGIILAQLLRGAPRAFGGPSREDEALQRGSQGSSGKRDDSGLAFIRNLSHRPSKASLRKIQALFADADESPNALHPRKVIRGLLRLIAAPASSVPGVRSPGGEGVQEWLALDEVDANVDLKNLISLCLTPSSKKRPTASELLSHPFLSSLPSPEAEAIVRPRFGSGLWRPRVRLHCVSLPTPPQFDETYTGIDKEALERDTLAKVPCGQELWYYLGLYLERIGENLGEWLVKRRVIYIPPALNTLPLGLLDRAKIVERDGVFGPGVEVRELELGFLVKASRKSLQNITRISTDIKILDDSKTAVEVALNIVTIAGYGIRELAELIRHSSARVEEIRHVVSFLAIHRIPLANFQRPSVWSALLGVHFASESMFRCQALEARVVPGDEMAKRMESVQRQLALDLPRLHSYSSALQRSSVRARVFCILQAWSAGGGGEKGSRRYWQGFDSVATVVAMTFKRESNAWSVLERLSDTYLKNYLVEGSESILPVHMSLVSSLLLYFDPKLAFHLRGSQVYPDMYAVSWILTLMSHSLSVDSKPYSSSIYPLWDAIFSHPSPFPLFTVIALLLLNKEKLLKMDVNSILPFLSSFPHVKVPELASLSTALFRHTPSHLYDWALGMPFEEPSVSAWRFERRARRAAAALAVQSSVTSPPVSPGTPKINNPTDIIGTGSEERTPSKNSALLSTPGKGAGDEEKEHEPGVESGNISSQRVGEYESTSAGTQRHIKDVDEVNSPSISPAALLALLKPPNAVETCMPSPTRDENQDASDRKSIRADVTSSSKGVSTELSDSKDIKDSTEDQLRELLEDSSWNGERVFEKVTKIPNYDIIVLDVRRSPGSPVLPNAIHFPLEKKSPSRHIASMSPGQGQLSSSMPQSVPTTTAEAATRAAGAAAGAIASTVSSNICISA
ncbi:hypothetical protein AAMO2058_001643000 [Amorphochlora amoebiformis]